MNLHPTRRGGLVCLVLLVAALAGPTQRPVAKFGLDPRPVRGSSATFVEPPVSRIHLPLIYATPALANDAAIWLDAAASRPHDVVFFRHTFFLDQPLETPELAIFADTRYEVWVDGVFLGRGPARFSRRIHEYDTYRLPTLAPGPHLIAVLVQWAPNNRRSESTRPYLQAHVKGRTAGETRLIARTGAGWKAWRPSAWQQEAVLVHSDGLIGPTELLDLRDLPRDWMAPTFADSAWSAAVVTSGGATGLQPRSIPPLKQVAIPVTVKDSGALSPGRIHGEITPPLADPSSISFRALRPTEFSVEAVGVPGAEPSRGVTLDGEPLAWERSSGGHPDVYRVSRSITAGMHSLTFAGLSSRGLSFNISSENIEAPQLAFSQGVHAGNRLLLAQPAPGSALVSTSTADGLHLTVTGAPAYVVLDLGRVIHGRVRADISGPDGTVVDMGWDDRLWRDTRPLPYPGSLHPQWNQTDSWVLDGTERSITTIDTRSGRYLLIAIWGSGPVDLRRLQVYEERYPVEQRGGFASNNRRLDQIWQIGVETLYPNMNDSYTDGWRERGQWWGDAYVEEHINRVAFGDTALLRRGLRLMADGFSAGKPVAMAPNGQGNYMLDYGMLWVQSLKDYGQLTGDIRLSVEVYPVLQDFVRYLETFENTATGLLDLPVRHWSQTSYIDTIAFADRYGQSTALNAMYYGTLRDAVVLASAVGNTGDASAWQRKAVDVRQAINSQLFVEQEHRYRASIYAEEARPPTPHAQAWALAYDIVPDSEIDAVAAALKELIASESGSPRVEIYGMFWVLEALGRAGQVSAGVDLIERYYGRLLDRGATSWWETFTSDQRYANTLAHGWGGAPTWFLSTYVLGATRTGRNTWEVRSSIAGQQSAAGSLPLENDALEIAWTSDGCTALQLRLRAPEGSSGHVVLATGDEDLVLTLNGNIVWQDGRAAVDSVTEGPHGITLALESGQYLLDIQRTCYQTYLPIVS